MQMCQESDCKNPASFIVCARHGQERATCLTHTGEMALKLWWLDKDELRLIRITISEKTNA